MASLSPQQRRALLALLDAEIARAEAEARRGGSTEEELARARSARAELLRQARLGGPPQQNRPRPQPGRDTQDLKDGGGDAGELGGVRD